MSQALCGSPENRESSEREQRPGRFLGPSDPARQAKRIPIKILKMLSAHSGHIFHPEYLQPMSSTPHSPIELDAKKSPLALLAQTCSQIGKPDPQPSAKLSSALSSGEKECTRPSSSLKLGEAPSEDKSSFKPYSKPGGDTRKESGEKAGFRVPAVSCQSFTARPPSSSPAVCSPSMADAKTSDVEDKKEPEVVRACPEHSPANPVHSRSASGGGGASEPSQHRDTPTATKCDSASLAPGHVAPVSPYKAGHAVYPGLPPTSMGYHGSIVGAYTATYPSQFVSTMEPKPGLVGSPLSGAVGCPMPSKSANSSPLTGASPPAFMQGLCRDPYCLTYHNAPHLGGSACSSCLHDPSSLKSAYPLVYPSHPLHSSVLTTGTTPPLGAHPLYTYGFMLHSEPLPHICNWVSAGGPCDKRFSSSEELLNHLRSHTALPGTDKLLAAYPPPASCNLHLPQAPPGSPNGLSLRSPHTLALSRYHPYSKSHLSVPTSSALTMSAASPYYSPYSLYGQRLASASALGYQ
ncbi:zinc finger protein 703-like [Chiloscyllium plagiosum]|uniref:zinc finger protein 703-like n=1 Tax=Chiloscyllium plagiosum TaxID=36176 RepID=UPI001CB825A7|nr:zinc finger protein 703-like [Chiloscyllium plagiosum]